MKHVGKMKNNGAKVAIVYRTLPGDPHSALVVGTQGLTDMHHDGLMTVVESESGQQANELADVLAVRKFADGTNMLAFLHTNGHLKKVPTSQVTVTPQLNANHIALDELNNLIAEQKGVQLEDLAVNDGSESKTVATKKPATKKDDAVDSSSSTGGDFELTPAELRSRADALFKQAQALRKQADSIDPPKKKTAKAEA
jgi:hypothetical protein